MMIKICEESIKEIDVFKTKNKLNIEESIVLENKNYFASSNNLNETSILNTNLIKNNYSFINHENISNISPIEFMLKIEDNLKENKILLWMLKENIKLEKELELKKVSKEKKLKNIKHNILSMKAKLESIKK